MFKECSRGDQVMLEPSILVRWRGSDWLRPKDNYIKKKSWQTFESTWYDIVKKIGKEFISREPSYGQNQTLHLHFTEIRRSNTTWTLIKI